jgi:hypothetical protein
MAGLTREERLQIMLTVEELQLIDDWRFKRRMPTRASAIRELLRLGLISEGVSMTRPRAKSSDYSVIPRSNGKGDGEQSSTP